MLNSYFYQVFLLVNENTVKRYKSALADEIEPVITELIERAQQGLSTLEKKEHNLQTKVNSTQFFQSYMYAPCNILLTF